VRGRIAIGLLALALALGVGGCGAGGLRGSLEWQGAPTLGARSASGVVRNTTGHAVDIDAHALRLLDDQGRKVDGRFSVATPHLAAHATTRLEARWHAGKPVRIDYGAGTLRLTSG
jgi:hypothetical protein